MAGPSRGASPKVDLGEAVMKDLFESLYPLRTKWKSIGLQIGLPISEIKAIEMQYSSLDDRLLEVLTVRQKSKLLTWDDIRTALRSESVNESRRADSLREKFGHSNEHGSSLKKREPEESSSCSSDTDESSPECDVILTEAEKKKLIRIFRKNFGKICYKMDNPVDTAAQCQANSLMSHSKMETILRLSESKQEKIIFLVHALEKRVKSHPQKIYAIIKIFLENKSLVDIGNEMQIEVEKVCPERAGTDCDLPHPQCLGNFKKSKKIPVPDKLSDKNTSLLTTVTERDSLLSQQVRQPPPLPGLNAVLLRYKNYLQQYYSARALAPADKFIPSLKGPYINLAMTKTDELCSPDCRDKYTRRSEVDEILKSKAPIGIADLFTRGKGENPIRFILVEGPPGIGKSTFAWELCRRWDEIESIKGYHAVVLLRLREKWVLQATSLSDLFRYPFQHELSEIIAQELDHSQGKNLLLVLDGFDEVSHSFHKDSVIKSILCKQLLPECTIILTTRPVANATLRSICQPQIDKHIEIIGFTEEERVRYITEVFSKEPELQGNFLKYMFLVPHIKSMMYIPLNCAIIAQVYYESQSSHDIAIPRTRTQLYKALTHCLVLRHMKTKENECEYASMYPEGLNPRYKHMFRGLAKFAFDSYHRNNPRKITFYKEDIPNGLVHFGFMNESTEMYATKGVEKSFSFLHLSLQEYLAAWHLVQSYSIQFQIAYHRLATDAYLFYDRQCPPIYNGNNKEEKVLIHSLDPYTIRYSLVEPAIFLAGISGWKTKRSRNHWRRYIVCNNCEDPTVMVRSLYEAQNSVIVSQWSACGKRRHVKIGARGSQIPYECYALSYCLANSRSQFDLSLFISDENHVLALETFVRGLKDHFKSSTPRIKQLHLQFSKIDSLKTVKNTVFWLKESKLLTEVNAMMLTCTSIYSDFDNNFFESFIQLQSLKVVTDNPTSWVWLCALNSLKYLKVLKISSKHQCALPPNDWPVYNKLAELVFEINFLSEQGICHLCSSAEHFVHSMLKPLVRSNEITKIVVPNVSRQSMACVHKILLHCPCLTKLDLTRTRLGYDGILYICSSLRHDKSLKILKIYEDLPPKSYNSTDGEGLNFVSFLAVKCVPLPTKIRCTDFLLELNNILLDNTTLEEIKIQCGLFIPWTPIDFRYNRWTKFGPLQQFNTGAVINRTPSTLRRSYSSSDLTRPQTYVYWNEHSSFPMRFKKDRSIEIDFNRLFSKRKEKGMKLFSLPSFSAPDTKILQSFSGLDPRLKKCLKLSDPKSIGEYDCQSIDVHVEWLGRTFSGLLISISEYLDESEVCYVEQNTP